MLKVNIIALCALSAVGALADEIPSEYIGTWTVYSEDCKSDGTAGLGTGRVQIQPNGINFDYAQCRVVSIIGSAHPGWHTDTLLLRCNNGVGSTKQIWHVQEIDSAEYLSATELTRQGPESRDGPSVIIRKRCK